MKKIIFMLSILCGSFSAQAQDVDQILLDLEKPYRGCLEQTLNKSLQEVCDLSTVDMEQTKIAVKSACRAAVISSNADKIGLNESPNDNKDINRDLERTLRERMAVEFDTLGNAILDQQAPTIISRLENDSSSCQGRSRLQKEIKKQARKSGSDISVERTNALQ